MADKEKVTKNIEEKSIVDDAVKETLENKTVDLGDYSSGEGDVRLTQEQILGIGGGTVFYEILSIDGRCRKHVAMPSLIDDRNTVKDLLKEYAETGLDRDKAVNDRDLDSSQIVNKLSEIDDRQIAILLKLSFHCFKRIDPVMQGLDEQAGIEKIKKWIDVKQLRSIPEVAMGLNRFDPLTGMALPR